MGAGLCFSLCARLSQDLCFLLLCGCVILASHPLTASRCEQNDRVPISSRAEAQIPSEMVLGGGASGGHLGHDGGAVANEVSALRTRDCGELGSALLSTGGVRTRREGGHLQAGPKPTADLRHLDRGLSHLTSARNKCL